MDIKFLRNKFFLTVVNIFVAGVSIVIIIFQLNKNWDLVVSSFEFSNCFFLLLAFILMPINWLLEAIKWRFLVNPIKKISLYDAWLNVLAGLPYGIIFPSRMGEWYGRIRNFKEKTQGFVLSSLGGIAQQIITLTAGVIALIYMKFIKIELIGSSVIAGILMISVFFLLWKLNFMKKVNFSFSKLKVFSIVLILSGLRYLIFTTQYVLLLKFFSVIVPIDIMYSAISITYLISYLVPLNFLVDLGLRSSTAIFLFESYTNNLLGVMVSGIGVWFINIAIPTVLGVGLLLRESVTLHKNF